MIKGMDQKYKRNSSWSLHGDKRAEKAYDNPSSSFEAYDLIRTAFLMVKTIHSPRPTV